MLKSFRNRTHNIGVVGHIQIGRNAKTSWGTMGQTIDHFVITNHEKDDDGKSFKLDHELMQRLFPMTPGAEQSHLGNFAKCRRLRVYSGAEVARGLCKVDRGLYIGASRSCYSEDGETATWYAGKDGLNHLPPVMVPLRTDASEQGDRVTVKCLEDQCPLVLDPLFKIKADGSKGTVWKCKVRGTFRFRIEGAGPGLYNFDTTSGPSTEASWALLEWLERETGGNMGDIPLDLIMTQHSTEYGKSVWRTNLQFACGRQELFKRALAWKRMREELQLSNDPPPAIERDLEEPTFASQFHGMDDDEPSVSVAAQNASRNAQEGGGGTGAAPATAKAPERPNPAPSQPPPAPAAPAEAPDLGAFRQAIAAALKRTDPRPWPAEQVARLLDHLAGASGAKAHDVPPDRQQAAIRRLAGPPPEDAPAAAPAAPPQAPRAAPIPAPAPSAAAPGGEASEEDKLAVLELSLTIDQIREVVPGFDPSRPLTAAVAQAVLAKYRS